MEDWTQRKRTRKKGGRRGRGGGKGAGKMEREEQINFEKKITRERERVLEERILQCNYYSDGHF